MSAITPQTKIVKAWAGAASPPPNLTVSQWSDAERYLPESSSTRGGRWVTARTPYLKGIMDAVHEPGVKTIAVEKCAQVGGSEALHNIIGYFIQYDPCPTLFVHPTVNVAEEWSKERLSDMIRTTPALRKVISEKRAARGSEEAESTLALKIYPGGFLALGGANTPNTFARRAVRLAIGDDVDRFPPVVGEEGDPIELLTDRTTTFYDALVLLVSTPTLKGGRIDSVYSRSDQRRYHITCPACGFSSWITWSDPKHFRVLFDERDAHTARLECPMPDHGGCGYQIYEAERRRLIAEGEWRPTVEPKEAGLVGFHLPAMVSTLGDVSIVRLVERWLAARGRGKEALRAFINTRLAEGWEDRTAKIEPHTLSARREHYGLEGTDGIEVPARAVILTAGVDVQEDRFELQVQGWGPADERWVVDYRVIPGDPRKTETRAALLEALQRRYLHESGVELGIHATMIDSGYATDEVYDFVLVNQHRRIFATKGIGDRSGEPIVGKFSEKRRGKGGRPVRLYPINVDDAKADVINCISILEPGPGAMHWPLHLETINEEYFAGLCSEHRETRYNKLKVATHTVWVKDRDRNEPLDTAVLCLAAIRLVNPNLRQHAERIAQAAKASSLPETPAPATPTKEEREKWITKRPGWLKGRRP